MVQRLVLLAVCCSMLAALPAGAHAGDPQAATARIRHCKQASWGYGAMVGIRARAVSCRRARSIARMCGRQSRVPSGWSAYLTGRTLAPWGTGEITVVRGRHQVWFGGVGGGGTCT